MPKLITYLFCMTIVATLAGGIGGSFQPARVIVAVSALVALIVSNVSVGARIVARAWTMAAIMILFGAVSLFWTADIVGGIGLVLAISVGALSFYVVARADLGQRGVDTIMWAWVFTVALSIPVAAYEIATGNHFAFALDERNVGGNLGQFPFASIFFGNYNDYSAWLCLSFPITLATFMNARSTQARLFTILIAAATVGIIFVNTSRAALGYVAVISILYMAASKKLRAYGVGVIGLLIPYIIIRYQEQVFRLYDLAVLRFETVGAGDESYFQRSSLIEAGYTAVRDSFGFGIGAGGFDEYIIDYYPYLIPNPHNILLEISTNFGLAALLGFVTFLVRLATAGWKGESLPVPYRITLISAAASVPIIGIISSQAIGYIYWWVWLATLTAMASVRTDPVTDPHKGAER